MAGLSEDEELIDMALDEDGNFVVGPDGDAVLITGADVVVQDVANELMTALGSIWMHENYGGNAIRFMQAEDSALRRKELAQEVILTIRKHEYVPGESVAASVLGWEQPEAIHLQASFSIQTPGAKTTTDATLLVTIDQNGVRVTKG